MDSTVLSFKPKKKNLFELDNPQNLEKITRILFSNRRKMIRKIVIVDYGMGNIKSVQRGLEQVGVTAILSADPKVIATASHLVLPGVGAFEDGMKVLEEAGLITAILDFVKTGNPFELSSYVYL